MSQQIVDVGIAGNNQTGDTLRDAFVKTNSNFSELYTNIDSLEASKAPLSHNHTVGQITGLQGLLDNKSNLGHTHVIADVTGLQTALDGKAATSHTHSIAQITGLQTSLNSLDNRILVLEGASGVVQSYSVPLGFTSHPLADETLLLHVFAEGVEFPDDWAGSRGRIGTPPGATYTFIIRRNSTQVGTISVNTSGTVTFNSSGPVVFVPGDLLEVRGATTPDTTIANCTFTLLGTIS